MTANSMTSADPAKPDRRAVEQEYGELAGVYAAKRAEAAEALGRNASARKWRQVERDFCSGDDGADNG
jgi:hypothetical protein